MVVNQVITEGAPLCGVMCVIADGVIMMDQAPCAVKAWHTPNPMYFANVWVSYLDSGLFRRRVSYLQ